MMTLREFAEFNVKATQKLFNDRKTVNPMFVAESDGRCTFIPVDFINDLDKDMVVTAVRELFRELKVTRYAYICEAWAITLPADADVNKAPRPSKHPDRIEMLVIEVEDTTNHVHAHMMINRDGDSVTLGDPEYDDGPSLGRFVGLLKMETLQ